MTETETKTVHTVEEALDRFDLIAGAGSLNADTACAMTALSWVAGEAWTDHPECSHSLLSMWAIRANDASTTSARERADIVRAGATGILDTWWIPTPVVIWLSSQTPKSSSPVERILDLCNRVTGWKSAATKERPDLRGADLRGADLRGVDLRGADLRGADLGGADLRGVDLGGVDLRGADLRGADLRGVDLRGVDLRGVDLGGADLRGVDLGGVDLRGADLRGAVYTQYTLWPDGFDVGASGAVKA